MLTRRQILISALTSLAGGTLLKRAEAATPKNEMHLHTKPSSKNRGRTHYTPVVTPNGNTLPYKMKNGVKEFHLIAEPVEYNGQTPGPTIEAVEGDRVRILVTNKLAEHTTIHWHGIFLPNGMDGVGGLNQPHIKPGETYVYEFTLRQFIPKKQRVRKLTEILPSCFTSGPFIRVPTGRTRL
jgi:FtsP/CotA-like multicopper oxidase with cupredoxin domain